MSKPTFTSLFSGIGGIDLGAIAAGFEPCEAVEHDPQLAKLHEANIGGNCHVMDILEANPFKFEKVDLLHASPVCFPRGTLVLTEQGQRPIEEIVSGDFVVTHESRLRKVTNTLTRSAQVLELKGQGHYGLTTTHDHPFLSVEKKIIYPPHKERKAGNWSYSILSEPQWVEASRLKGRHWLSLTQYPPTPIPEMVYSSNESLRGQTFPLSPSFFKVAGLWVGNGCVRYSEGKCNRTNRGEVIISCNKKKVDAMRQDLISAGIKFHERVRRTTVEFFISSRPLCRWLVENFGKLAHGKKIPLWLLGASYEVRSSFFAGYIATDGSISKRKGVAIGLSATTVSKSLAFGVRMLGLTLGYSVTLHKHFPNPKGIIEGRVINQSPIHSLRFVQSEKLSFVSTIYRSGCVRETTLLPEPQEVFCLTVEEDESFVADGLVVHNCKSYSIANVRREEKQLDIDCAKKVVEFIQVLQPPTFSLENVKQYASSKSFDLIRRSLRAMNYATNVAIVNAKDFGVPQSRERLILRAWRKGSKRPRPLSLYKIEGHIGWYEAIADIIPTLKPQSLNSWQLASLAEQGISVEGLTALVSKDGSRKKKGFSNTFALIIPSEKPCPTLKALGHSQHCQQYSIVVNGVGYRISTQAIARLMSFPNSFKFLGTNYKDCMGLGNAVPPLLGRAIAQSFN